MKYGIDYIGSAVVFFCHDGKGRIFMSKRGENTRDESGTWDIGGGAIEIHDNVEDTLKREIKEEYCTDVLEYEFLGYRDVHKMQKGEKLHCVVLDFKVLVDPSKAKNGEPHKFDAVGWFTLDTMPSPLFSQLPIFLEKYKDKLK